MGHLELCCFMDQHEFMYSYLYAGKFIDRGRYELVAGHSNYFFGQYNRFDPNDIKWTCRSQIWNTFSCFCKSQFWNKRRQHSGNAKSHCCLWMVWYTNMDRWCCYLLYAT